MARPGDRATDSAHDEDSPLADPGLRLAARAFDDGVPMLPAAVLFPLGAAVDSSTLIWTGFAASAAVMLALWVVNLVLLHRHGQTVGKRLLGLRIIRRGGDRAGFGRLFGLRIVLPGALGSVPLLGPLFWLVDALFVFTDERQTLHDRLADTIVVDIRRRPPEVPTR